MPIALSGTREEVATTPWFKQSHIFVSENSDRTNIFYQILRKPSNVDIASYSESIYVKELNQSNTELEDYPVMLRFMPAMKCS